MGSDCILSDWPKDPDGYGRTAVNGENVKAHRVAYEQEHGPIPDDLLVCHSCDNPPCINVEHLFLGTVKDNDADSRRKGRQPTTGHGKTRMYMVHGCRCKECCEANTEHVRRYRERKRCRSTPSLA